MTYNVLVVLYTTFLAVLLTQQNNKYVVKILHYLCMWQSELKPAMFSPKLKFILLAQLIATLNNCPWPVSLLANVKVNTLKGISQNTAECELGQFSLRQSHILHTYIYVYTYIIQLCKVLQVYVHVYVEVHMYVVTSLLYISYV